LSTLNEEIAELIRMFNAVTSNDMAEIILSNIETKIDEKIQHVNEVLNDPRLTIQGCQRLKGRKDAFEEMKEMLKS
jgi:hypothetical protein